MELDYAMYELLTSNLRCTITVITLPFGFFVPIICNILFRDFMKKIYAPKLIEMLDIEAIFIQIKKGNELFPQA